MASPKISKMSQQSRDGLYKSLTAAHEATKLDGKATPTAVKK
jgi:hypothetical protein